MLRLIFDFVSSLKLTIACLAAAIVLVFAGTIAQVHLGIHEVQQLYFQSLFVWWPPNSNGFKIPIYPGGRLIGAVLLANLITAHIRRFQWTWRKFGIQLIHAGLIVMLLGGLLTDLFSVDSYMRLAIGETKNYSEDLRLTELVVIDESDSDLDQVTAIPQARLQRGGTIEHSSLPFRILVRRFYPNSQIGMLSKAGANAQAAATQGVGSRVVVTEAPRDTTPNGHDTVSVVIEIEPIPTGNEVTAASLGTWLVSDGLGAPQEFFYSGKQWRLELRPVRYYKHYSMTLQKFTHERYPGTEIPKNFASRVTLTDPEHKENRNVLIYMNHPLRYRGETYYQAGFDKSDKATVLEVVHNPGIIAPYAACVIVAAGLLVQFSFHLTAFLRRRKPAS